MRIYNEDGFQEVWLVEGRKGAEYHEVYSRRCVLLDVVDFIERKAEP